MDYTPTGNPVDGALGDAAEIQAEFALIQAAIASKADSDSPVLISPELGNATATSVLTNSASVSGYTTGAGAAVTQLTSKSTGVTINKPCGKITTHNENLAAGAVAGFTVSNSLVSADDVIILTPKDGNGYKYRFSVYSVTNGSFVIAVKNDTAGPLAEALPINFAVIGSSES